MVVGEEKKQGGLAKRAEGEESERERERETKNKQFSSDFNTRLFE